MIIELFGITGLAALAAMIFIFGLCAVNEARRWPGIILGILLMSGGAAGFVASMIMFAMKYSMYLSLAATDAMLKALGG